MAASCKKVELARCSHGANFGDLKRALRSRVGVRAALGTLPPYEQSASWKGAKCTLTFTFTPHLNS